MNKSTNILTNDDLTNIGFKEIPHFTIGDIVVYDLKRNRELSASSVGTPNEMLFLCQKDKNEITDLICIHNYDYDGYLTIEKVEKLIEVFE